jgi:C-terminal processing protease CtpA/Prc
LYCTSIVLYIVADRNGQLRVGDKIVRVNGVCTESLAHDEVADLLRCGGDPLTLTIQRLQSTNMFAWFGSARRLAKRLSSTFQNHVQYFRSDVAT